MTLSSAAPDFEAYAKDKPFFYDRYVVPELLKRAAAGLTGTFVEIGAGDGQKLRSEIDDGTFAGFSLIYAYDISEERIKRLRVQVPEAHAAVASADAVPLADGTVDFVFSD